MWDPPIHFLVSTPFRAQPLRWYSFPSPIDVRPSNPLLLGPASLLTHHLVSTPLQGLASSLTHRLVSDSDIICNSIADIVLFVFFLSSFLSRFLKRSTRERFSHPYKECFVFTSNWYEISQKRSKVLTNFLIYVYGWCCYDRLYKWYSEVQKELWFLTKRYCPLIFKKPYVFLLDDACCCVV